MKKETKQKITAGIAIGGLTLGTIFGVVACDNGSTSKTPEEIIPEEVLNVYGIPVTGDNAESHIATIKAAVDELAVLPNHATYIKNNVKEFRIIPGTAPVWVGIEDGKLIVKISTGTLGISFNAARDEIAAVLYEYANLHVAFLQFDNSKETVRLAFAHVKGQRAI